MFNEKKCLKCKRILSLDCFDKDKSKRDGFKSLCKKCRIQWSKKYYQKNKKRLTEYQKQYYQKNKEKIIEFIKKYNQIHSHQNYQNNRKKLLEYGKQYYKNNKKERINYSIEYGNRKYKEDSKFRLSHNISSVIRKNLKKRKILKNGQHWEILVGFKLKELIIHFENLFQVGMTWENYGKWHLDHIKPISLFDFQSADDPGFKECWALKNLQPLWANDNYSKSNKY